MNRYGKRCVLYPRVSTEMQVDGYSLEGQKNMLTRFADREEMIVVDTYEDAGKSGKSIEGRPAFQKMLRDIEDGLDIDYILVYKLSRFGRNAADILNSLELVQSYGVNLICIEEGIDSSQTSGKLLISVLSAVAEIERENIIEQTMNGRREKARQGGWNGGFAPYGYTLEDNKLMIEETEAVAIRKIFELYTSSEIGLGGIANQLNLQGIRKIPRQNGTLEDWTGHFIKLILDNPVYCGKIAYGRRTKEKVKGTKNDYQMKRNDDYILTEGQHKGIVSEEVWEKAHAKRLRTGVKQPSKIGRDRVHLLSGLLKCPVCGSPMYTNKHAWTNKDGTYKEIYYYVCSRNRMVRGKHCEYKAMLKKTDIEPMVIEAIREIVRNEEYAQAIKKRIGVQIDTKAVDKELEGYQAKLKEVDLNKTRLEREIDSLPVDAKYRERKLHDMTLRLDSLYDVIVELEEKIEDARLRRDAIKQQAITLENIYKIMVNFDCVYNIINDEEKRNVVTALIKEIEIYRNDESEYPLKRIGLNFPVFKDGGEVTELLWDKGNTVEAVVGLHLPQTGLHFGPEQLVTDGDGVGVVPLVLHQQHGAPDVAALHAALQHTQLHGHLFLLSDGRRRRRLGRPRRPVRDTEILAQSPAGGLCNGHHMAVEPLGVGGVVVEHVLLIEAHRRRSPQLIPHAALRQSDGLVVDFPAILQDTRRQLSPAAGAGIDHGPVAPDAAVGGVGVADVVDVGTPRIGFPYRLQHQGVPVLTRLGRPSWPPLILNAAGCQIRLQHIQIEVVVGGLVAPRHGAGIPVVIRRGQIHLRHLRPPPCPAAWPPDAAPWPPDR